MVVARLALTHKVLHHGRVVVWGGGQAEELFPPWDGGVVDGLHVDVVSLQQRVAHPGVELRVPHLHVGAMGHNTMKQWHSTGIKAGIKCMSR